MAKKTPPNNQTSSSSVSTNTFIKGMNKDISQAMEPSESWWHARNAANNSNDGDVGVIGNEPSNLLCGVIPYTIIGAIHRFGDEWIIRVIPVYLPCTIKIFFCSSSYKEFFIKS